MHSDTGLATGVVDVVITRLEIEPDALRHLTETLSDAERHRARQFVFDRDRRRFIVSRARLRQLVAEQLDVPESAVEFTSGVHGKPAVVLRPADPDVRFNVSHCGDVAVYALTSGLDVGVDIEAVRPIPDADRIAERFFSRRECEAYRALDAHDKPLGFFNCWTRKEAFVKALGNGLTHSLDRFDVSLAPEEPARILRVGETPGDQCGWDLQGFSPAPGFVGAIVTERTKLPMSQPPACLKIRNHPVDSPVGVEVGNLPVNSALH
jgi:4'-phosphopantetheinyl transferase